MTDLFSETSVAGLDYWGLSDSLETPRQGKGDESETPSSEWASKTSIQGPVISYYKQIGKQCRRRH